MTEPPMTEPKCAGPFTIAIYNPALLRKEDLIRGFVARQPRLDRLLDDLRREGNGNAPQHHLIIGQRGLGKTTLLRRLAFAVEDDAQLAAAWMPLVFPEEQYNVASLGDFWLNCLDALSDALDRSGDRAASRALDSRVEGVPGAEAERSGAALRLLLDEADRLGRRVLLLVDNIDIVLDRLKKDEEWEFRRAISEEHRLHIMGASSRVLEALYEHGRAFYDFFQVHELKGFDEADTFSTLCHLAEQSGNAEVGRLVREKPSRIKALRVLTGGNPRTLVLLFKVLAQGPEGDVQRDLEQLLDEHTAQYKARFEGMAPQAQQLVAAMAIHWDPLTAAELTERLGTMGVNQVSAQLKRLEDFGVVEKTAWYGEKKNAFQIAERFFNIWYVMRASRRVRRRLVWLVKFLEAWYDQAELDARARGFLEVDPEAMGRERYAEMALAYSQAVPDKYLGLNLESAGLHAVLDDGERRLIDFSDLPEELQGKKERIEQLRELRTKVLGLQIDWGGIEPGEFWLVLGGSPHFSMMEKARIVERLASLGREGLGELYGRLKVAKLRLRALYPRESRDVTTLYGSLAGGELADVYDCENAIAVAKRYGLRQLPFIAIRSRTSRWVRGETIPEDETKKAELALKVLTEEQGFEALAWNCLGHLLADQPGRHAEAEQAYRRAIELDPQFAYPQGGLGNLLQRRQRYEEAEQAFRRAIELQHFPQFARPWYDLGGLLYHLKRYDEAEQTFRRAIAVDPDFGVAWNGLGGVLQFTGRYEEAEQAYRRAIELEPQLCQPWNNLAYLLHCYLKRYEEAEEAYRSAIELDPELAVPWSNLGGLLEPIPGRQREAGKAFLRACEIDPARVRDLECFLRVCDRLAESPGDLPAVLKMAQRASELAPDNRRAQLLLAQVLTLAGQWPDASRLLERLAANESASFSDGFFRAAVKTGHVDEVIAILERTGASETWRPLYEALRAVRERTPDYLRKVAPEVRAAALEILRVLDPDLAES